MARVLLISLGSRDRLSVDGLAFLAALRRVAPESVVRLEDLAEHALKPCTAALAALFAGPEKVVAGCSRPRAARALLAFAGLVLDERRVEWVALPFDREALKREYGVPWYPVIDRALCTGCGTCHDYCLFSVYSKGDPAGLDAQRVRVTAPLNCKTGCPACARLCPEGAVIFPFCHEAELNGEIEHPKRRSSDELAAALGDDPMRVLAERRKQKLGQLLDPDKFAQAEKDRITYSGVL